LGAAQIPRKEKPGKSIFNPSFCLGAAQAQTPDDAGCFQHQRVFWQRVPFCNGNSTRIIQQGLRPGLDEGPSLEMGQRGRVLRLVATPGNSQCILFPAPTAA